MTLALDHLVVAARTLEEGAAWLEARLGLPTVEGGRHALMGTHNRLLSLGDSYLEVIAVDPAARPPGRPRWFGLDTPAMRARLANGPALVHWVARTGDILAARETAPALVGGVLALERGDFRWRIGVATDGNLPAGGAFPTIIQWEGDRHPCASLPDHGCRLESLAARTPQAGPLGLLLASLGFADSERVHLVPGDRVALSAALRTPRGMVLLPESPAVE